MEMRKIKWLDAHGQCTDMWESIDAAKQAGQDGTIIETVGMVLMETDRFITLIFNYHVEGSISGRITIPNGWIIESKTLKEVEDGS